MKIAIIGTGNMATGLATEAAAAGYEVSIASREPDRAAELAGRIGRGAVGGGLRAALEGAGLVIPAVPYHAAAEILAEAGDLSGTVVVDITNPLNPDYKSLTIGHSTSAAEEIQARIPNARVVKAFNTIFASLVPAEARAGHRLQVFLAGEDADAKEQVSSLARAIGFEPVDAGPLSNARYLEPLAEMTIHFGYFLGHGPVVAPAWIKVRN